MHVAANAQRGSAPAWREKMRRGVSAGAAELYIFVNCPLR